MTWPVTGQVSCCCVGRFTGSSQACSSNNANSISPVTLLCGLFVRLITVLQSAGHVDFNVGSLVSTWGQTFTAMHAVLRYPPVAPPLCLGTCVSASPWASLGRQRTPACTANVDQAAAASKSAMNISSSDSSNMTTPNITSWDHEAAQT